MTDLLDEVMAWVRAGSAPPDTAVLTDTVMGDDARLLAAAFTGEDGRKRLMLLARLTVLRPPVDHRLPDGPRQAYAEMRSGQDSIFAAVVRYLDLHAENQRTSHERSHSADQRSAGFGWSTAGHAAVADAGDERFADTGDGAFDPAGLVGGR